jgi:universal stress protein E
VPARRRHLEEGHPALVLPALARRLHADMVVMGAVSRSGWQRLLIGNTAEQIIDDLKCDLLIVKPAHFGSKIQRRRRGVWLVPTLTQF